MSTTDLPVPAPAPEAGEVRPFPFDLAAIQHEIKAAIDSLPAEAPAAVIAVADGEGAHTNVRLGVVVRVGKSLSFAGWLDKPYGQPLRHRVEVAWYPGMPR